MHIPQQQQQQLHQGVTIGTPSFQHQPPTSIPSTPQTGILLFLTYEPKYNCAFF